MRNLTDMPAELRWAWSGAERQRVLTRFQAGLHRLLRAFEAWQAAFGSPDPSVATELASRLENAGADLDVCAANCHALAATLRATAGQAAVQPGNAHAAVRLARAVGAPVVLTRTTIGQLAGRRLRLEYLDGANAVVQIDGEYWGTPIDRVLVVNDTAETDLRPDPPPPAFHFQLRRGELSNAIQFLTMTGRTGVLEVALDGDPAGTSQGQVTIASGRVIRAQWDGHQDLDAVARMMTLNRSVAHFLDQAVSAAATLNLATDQLLIEAAVKADELGP